MKSILPSCFADEHVIDIVERENAFNSYSCFIPVINLLCPSKQIILLSTLVIKIKRKGDIKSPCLSPFQASIQSELSLFIRGAGLLEFKKLLIQDIQLFLEPLALIRA